MSYVIAFPIGSKRREMLAVQGWRVPAVNPNAVERRCCACGMKLLVSRRASEELSRHARLLFCPWCGNDRATRRREWR
jgi:hypothetical protein